MALVINDIPCKYVAGQQTTLDEHRPVLPTWIKLFLRWVYHRYGWAAIEGIQFRGSFDEEAEARWAASCTGGWYRAVPHNGPLQSDLAVQFGIYDHPSSEASAEYRNRELPFVAVPRSMLENLDATLQQTKSA